MYLSKYITCGNISSPMNTLYIAPYSQAVRNLKRIYNFNIASSCITGKI